MSVKCGSATEATEAPAGSSTGRSTSAPMDTTTAEYVRKHHLASVTRALVQVISNLDGDLLRRSRHCRTGETAPPGAATAALENTTLSLRILLSSLTTPPSPALPSGGIKSGTNAVASVGSIQGAPWGGSAAVATSPSSASDLHGCVWPIHVTFATKEDAMKAEVCRCIALHCERLLTGVSLVESFGRGLRWTHLVPNRDGGGERLGVALVLCVFRCWERVVVPLLQQIGDHTSRCLGASSVTLEALFDGLVKRHPATVAPSAEVSPSSAEALAYEETAYWCFALLCGYCQDFPETVWASILRAAQDAAVQERCNNAEGFPPPLTSEALLLRSFIAHLSCSEMDAANTLSAAALTPPKCDDIIASHMSVAVAAARACSESWVWAEVELLLLQTCADATASSMLLPVLLRADGYWAVLMQPYTAMLDQYYM